MSTSPRRTQRSKKVCAFQVKKATGRTVVRSARLPSTRQYTRGVEFGLWFSCSKSFSSRDLGTIHRRSKPIVNNQVQKGRRELGPNRFAEPCYGRLGTRILFRTRYWVGSFPYARSDSPALSPSSAATASSPPRKPPVR